MELKDVILLAIAILAVIWIVLQLIKLIFWMALAVITVIIDRLEEWLE